MMTGLPGYRTTAARPTGRSIFQALADLRLIPAHDGNPATIPNSPASRPGCWTSSTSTSADPAGSSSKTPCAKDRASDPYHCLTQSLFTSSAG